MTEPVLRRPIASVCVTLLLILYPGATGAEDGRNQSAPPDGRVTALRSVRVVKEGSATTVVIDADGPLPQPSSAALTDPPRIYVDLNGVSTASMIQGETSDPVIRRTRVALHEVTPLVTRVVVDLVNPVPYRIDATAKGQGRLVITLGGRALGPATAATAPPVRDASPAPSPETVPRTPARTSAIDAYGLRVASALARLHALRPLLVSIDKRTETAPADLNAAALEFDSLAKLLNAIKPPTPRESTHALLLRTCTFGARAARLREEAMRTRDPGWNAASAAAGALLMLDRANGELAGAGGK